MESISRDSRSRHHADGLARALVAALLVVSLGLEVLPFGFVDQAPATPGERGGRTLCIEPLQVCDHGGELRGALFDIPVLVPGAPSLFPVPTLLRLAPDAAGFAPDPFHPAIDHPPQLRA